MDNQTRYRRILATLCGPAWAIMPDKLTAMVDVVRFAAGGGVLSADEIEARVGARQKRKPVNGSVTVLPLFGVMSHRMNMMTDVSGGTSTELFGQWFDAAANDESVGAIVIDSDSPGGSVNGMEELSSKVFNARRSDRPIIAVANSMAASAAFDIVTAADEVVVTPGGLVGGVGTIAIHTEESKAREEAGITDTIISAGVNKAGFNDLEPLSDGGREQLQRIVDESYEQFVADVARNRGVKKSAVKADFGQGAVFGGRDAIARGMADRVGTLDDVLAGLGVRGRANKAAANMAMTEMELTANREAV